MKNLHWNTAFPLPGYISQFDGLRAFSILAVFVAHSEFVKALPFVRILQYGRVGVNLFLSFLVFSRGFWSIQRLPSQFQEYYPTFTPHLAFVLSNSSPEFCSSVFCSGEKHWTARRYLAVFFLLCTEPVPAPEHSVWILAKLVVGREE